MERAEALATPIARLNGWHLQCGCGPCRATVQVLLPLTRPPPSRHRNARATRLPLPAGTTLGQVVARLRCESCGTPPESVVLQNRTPGTGPGPPIIEVPLLPAPAGTSGEPV